VAGFHVRRVSPVTSSESSTSSFFGALVKASTSDVDWHAFDDLCPTYRTGQNLSGGRCNPVWESGICSFNHPVVELAAPPNSPFQVLIGGDIICRGTLSVSFDGHFTFSI
jgi:hypothetical protein